jgi:hypothetical protein
MKKFQIEMLFVALGVLLVLWTAGKQCWEQVVYATSCTSACGPDTSMCSGQNTLAACACDHTVTGKSWSNPITRGTAQGSINTTIVNVTCYIATPCVFDQYISGYGFHCGGVESDYACQATSGSTTITRCTLYKPGTPAPQTVGTCSGNGCGEG